MDANRRVKSRGDQFVERASTSIWKEFPSEENPYIANRCLCHGYDLLALVRKRSFVDVVYLLLNGNLPTPEQRELLERLMIGLCNPGPRHPATRAGMNAAVSKTYPEEILPIALLALSGSHLGAAEVQSSMRFLRKSWRRGAVEIMDALVPEDIPSTEGDRRAAPGFGSFFGGIDEMTTQLSREIAGLPGAGRALAWATEFASALKNHGMGWLTTGLAAAVFLDLGIHPRVGPGLFQLISAPGLLAHAAEMTPKPMTAMPFLPNDRYIDESDSKHD